MEPQHDDSTNPQHVSQGIMRVKAALSEAWPTPLNAWGVRQKVPLSTNRIKHLLSEGTRAGVFQRTTRGFYTIRTIEKVGEVLSDLRLENLVLVVRQHDVGLRGGRDRSDLNRPRPRQTRVDDLSREARKARHEVIDREERRAFYGPWGVYIQTFRNGTIELQLGTRGIPGLTLVDFLGFAGWVAGQYPDVPDDGPDGWTLKGLEMNRDLPGFRLDGGKAFTLRLFRNVWLKLYEKTEGPLRVEFRAAKVDLSLKDAVLLFGGYVDALLKLGVIRVEETRR